MLRYKNYKLIVPNKDQEFRISKLIEKEDGSVFHEVELNKVVEKTFKTQLYYLVDDPKSITSFSPVHLSKNKYGLKRYHFKPLYDIPYAGFLGDSEIIFKDISIGLFESFVYSGFPFVAKTKNDSGVKLYGETSMVDLSYDESYIFEKFINSKRRNMIRKAKKSGVRIEIFNSDKGLIHFWPILEELHKKLNYLHLNYQYYKDIIQVYGKKDQAFILVAFKDKNPISGIFILGNKNYMLYYKGASVFGIKNEGQGELLQWEAIKTSKKLGIKYYDLGNLDKLKLPEIYRFKTGISNNIIQYPIFSKNSISYRFMNKINAFINL